MSDDSAVDSLYPDIADPPLPRALPLREYTGTYSHPAYQNITVELASPRQSGTNPKHGQTKIELQAVRSDVVWQMTFDFAHVSGEFWLIYIDMLKTPNGLMSQHAKAEFRVGPGGEATQLVIEFMEEGSEGTIVFERVE